MPETNKRAYTAQSKSATPNSLGPIKGKGGATKWANPARTRGNKTGKFEQTLGSFTKLSSLKRR